MPPLVICAWNGTALEEEALGAVDKGTGAALDELGLGMSKLTKWRVVCLEAFTGVLVSWWPTGGS